MKSKNYSKKIKNKNRKQRYAVYSFYDCDIDILTITHAKPDDYKYDGDNWCGSNDAYRFTIYDSLEAAIKNAGYWPINIRYGTDFKNREKDIIIKVTNSLIKDPAFVRSYSASYVKKSIDQIHGRFRKRNIRKDK